MRWVLDKAFVIITGWIACQYALYTMLKQNNQQPYEYGLYGRIRYWLHGVFSVLEKKEVRIFRKPSKWRWGK